MNMGIRIYIADNDTKFPIVDKNINHVGETNIDISRVELGKDNYINFDHGETKIETEFSDIGVDSNEIYVDINCDESIYNIFDGHQFSPEMDYIGDKLIINGISIMDKKPPAYPNSRFNIIHNVIGQEVDKMNDEQNVSDDKQTDDNQSNDNQSDDEQSDDEQSDDKQSNDKQLPDKIINEIELLKEENKKLKSKINSKNDIVSKLESIFSGEEEDERELTVEEKIDRIAEENNNLKKMVKEFSKIEKERINLRKEKERINLKKKMEVISKFPEYKFITKFENPDKNVVNEIYDLVKDKHSLTKSIDDKRKNESKVEDQIVAELRSRGIPFFQKKNKD